MRKISIVVLIMTLVLTGCGIKHETIDESLTPVSSEESFEAVSPPSIPQVSFPSSAPVSEERPASSSVGISKEQAIAIAKEYALNKYNKSFEGYKVDVNDSSEINNRWEKNLVWNVFFYLADGGDALEVFINQSNGKVFDCMPQTFFGRSVETKEQAIALAKDCVFQMFDKSFEEDEVELDGKIYHYEIEIWNDLFDGLFFQYTSSEGIWLVVYDLFDENGERLSGWTGGGGPEVHIRKSDGRIVYCNLMR
jgi:Peptidase propeptide and YPEB domain.